MYKPPKQFKNQKGFTLIELLIVIVILSVISIIGYTNYINSLKIARDNKRKQDIGALKTALELYYQKYSNYKNGIFTSDDVSNWPNILGGNNYTLYINQMPQDPGNKKYYYTSDGTTYTICAQLETTQPASAKPANCPAEYNYGSTP